MDITLNNLETIETSRRNLLKYGALGISAMAGINTLQISLPLQVISSENLVSSNVVDYATKPYNVFLVSDNITKIIIITWFNNPI